MTTKQLLAALALALCGPAFAAGNHAHEHQPLHGGIVTEVADIDYELVAQPDTLTLHLRDHGKPLALDGASAKLTLLNGSEKTEATLSPAGDGKLQAKGSFKVAPGTKVVALVTVPGKKAANVRFAVK
ncbi:hypothetical protein GWK50_05645 [Acidovorax sp. 210-6]|jgi:hypothetical protein|uniref:hypothetical protein n=1 Tax=Acidovorax sp. 210-6 TaxID=2699468 RepID=UPI00138A3764|nr:hypothetical protein [Acidovorax sp. 210-6]NCU65334.1 hypothetical protein [Acidovorax sp. 210-6]